MAGYFFQKNRQRIAQWNPTRRPAPWGRGPIPQCVLHTFEWPPDRSMLSAATFLLTRTNHGSYHSLAGGTSERDVLRLAPVTAETWHCVPSNNWASGISATTYAARWNRLTAAQRRNFVHSMAYAAHLLSRELVAIGKPPIPAKRISRTEAMRGVWGFTYHRTMDPGRRTDPANPADDFPWAMFLAEYRRLQGDAPTPTPTPTPERTWFDMATKNDLRDVVKEQLAPIAEDVTKIKVAVGRIDPGKDRTLRDELNKIKTALERTDPGEGKDLLAEIEARLTTEETS